MRVVLDDRLDIDLGAAPAYFKEALNLDVLQRLGFTLREAIGVAKRIEKEAVG